MLKARAHRSEPEHPELSESSLTSCRPEERRRSNARALAGRTPFDQGFGQNWAPDAIFYLPISLAMIIVGADPAPIDFGHLARQTFADHALERELLELFAAQCDVLVPAIGDARRPQDGVMAAHTLKGSARAVGAWVLAALADRAETLLGAGDADGVAILMADVIIAAQAARAAALGRRASL